MSILDQVPTEAKIKAIVRKIVFGDRLRCPHCNSYDVRKIECRFYCKKCRKKFSLTSVSWLSGMRISYTQLWILIVCWQRRMSIPASCELASVSHVTVRRWFRRFQYNLPYERDNKLWGQIEVDEAFVGKRRTGNQRIVLGAYERSTGHIALKVTTNRAQETTDRFILESIETTSTIYTDAAMCYEGIDSFFGYTHRVCNHSEFVFGPTNHIEAVWSALKRFIRRTYQSVRAYWLPFLVKEFEARTNEPQLFKNPINYLNRALLFQHVY